MLLFEFFGCHDLLPVGVLHAMRAFTYMQRDSGMDTIKNIKTDGT